MAGIVGSLVIARVAGRVRADRLFAVCVLAVGLELLVVAFGPAISGINVGTTTIVQRETADAWQGRVFSLVATTSPYRRSTVRRYASRQDRPG